MTSTDARRDGGRPETPLWLDAQQPADDPVDPGRRYDVAVVGAGLTGLTTAVLLARGGCEVVVLESRRVGAGTTGASTAKLSLLQGTRLSELVGMHPVEVVLAYLESNREGQAWLRHYCDEHGIDHRLADAVGYATTGSGRRAVEAEHRTARRLGLPTELADAAELPFPTRGAVRLADQVQLDPVRVLDTMAADLRDRGGVLHSGARVREVRPGRPVVLETDRGSIRADRVLLATGIPVLDRGLHAAKLVPERSYVTVFRLPVEQSDALPPHAYLSADQPTRSLRPVPGDGGRLLMVGGNGHVTGRHPSPAAQVEDLTRWTTRRYPGAERVRWWAAQDYRSYDLLPLVEPMPLTGGRVHVATGYAKWGMTNAVAAALHTAGRLLGGHMDWARVLERRPTTPRAFVSSVGAGLGVATSAGRGWALGLAARGDGPPGEGDGVVHGDGVRPVAESTVDGVSCAVSAICTHQGGVVRWNDAERSWDCPLHGSRFAADGTLLEGPARHDLAPAAAEPGPAPVEDH